jgi:uncharacterized RDD family membrane protein YckC
MWYYVEDGQQRGPVAEADLNALRASGKITDDTLVWREGMATWLALRDALAAAAPTAADAPPVIGATGVTCAECGRNFPADQVVRFGLTSVCADCKPIYVQKLKEGATLPTGAMNYATFGERFGAKFLDGLILWVGQTAIGFAVGLLVGRTFRGAAELPTALLIMQICLVGFGIIVNIFYNAFFLSRCGATPGKMVAKIKVVTTDGELLSFKAALVRPLAEIVSGLICYIGYFMVLWDEEKRALHDRMCNTRVVKK